MWAQFGSHDAALRPAGIDRNSGQEKRIPVGQGPVLRAAARPSGRACAWMSGRSRGSCVGLGDRSLALSLTRRRASGRRARSGCCAPNAGLGAPPRSSTPSRTAGQGTASASPRGRLSHTRDHARDIRTSFGSYDAALRAAGIEPELPRTRGPLWDQDRVLCRPAQRRQGWRDLS